MKTKEEIIMKIRGIGNENAALYQKEINALLWVLDSQKDPNDWILLQQQFHERHPGPEKPDFRADLFLKWIGEGKLVLDAGPHTGVNANVYAAKNRVIGADLQPIIIKNADKYGFPCYPCDVSKDMDIFIDDFFDVVVAGELVEHLTNARKFVEDAFRVLKPKGRFIMSSPLDQELIDDPTHCNVVNDEFIAEIFKDKFLVVDVVKRSTESISPIPCVMILAESLKEEAKPVEWPDADEERFEMMRILLGERRFGLCIDMGCGFGVLTAKLADACSKIMGYDKNVSKICIARERFKDVLNLSFEVINLEKYVLSGRCDLVILSDVIYYLNPETQQRIMREAHNILIDGGMLLTSSHGVGFENEFDIYSDLFENVSKEYVGFGNQPKEWTIALWRKK